MANLDLGHLEKKDPKNPEMKLGCVQSWKMKNGSNFRS